MCLAIPGQIKSIDQQLDDTFRVAKVSFNGILREVNLSMVPDATVGDYVLVHVGLAISIVDEEEAKRTMEVLEQLGEIQDELGPEPL